MSGDVQPRKRKDKKKKKDELGVEEPRGTAAALGEGDVFMHSHHDHGTGGHWCAKIIFFSLLAVLITLIGLIILENRGLTELEANSVESRYSGVLEGWLEDAPDDDHHDEHTLELKHHDLHGVEDHSPEDGHDDDDEEHGDVDDHDDDDDHELDDHDDENDEDQADDDEDDDEHADDDESDDEADEDDDNDNENDENSEEQNLQDSNEEDDNDDIEQKFDEKNDNLEDDDDDDDDDDSDSLQNADDNDSAEDDGDDQKEESDDQSVENDNNDDDDDENDDANDEDNSNEAEQDEDEKPDEDEEEHEEEAEEDLAVEVERLEKEPSDDDAVSEEEPAAEPEDDDKSEEVSSELAQEDEADEASEDEEFLEPDDIEEDLPVVEQIVVPPGQPLDEVEDEPSTVKPADTLAEEEEYEKQQEELRREQEQASHMWLKVVVGGALLVATLSVVRRAIAPRDDTPASDDHASREETPVIDRRMTLIPEERAAAAAPREIVEEIVEPIEEKTIEKVSSVIKSSPPPKEEEVEEEEEEENEEDEEIIEEVKNVQQEQAKDETEEKELYSDEEEAEEEEEEIEEIPPPKPAPAVQKVEPPQPEADEDVPDDVEIIDEEQIEEELEEEEDEEEISDVDDAELLSRLEAKYGRLPEPERPAPPKHKDGGNSIEDDWPGEPSSEYWRQELDQAEQELRQGDWRAASQRVSADQLRGSARGRWLLSRALDAEAEARRDNRLLSRAIAAYLDVLKMNERLADARLLEVADKTLERIRFRGNYLSAEPVYRLLIRRFPDVPHYYNNLTISFLMANRADLAELVLEETLQKWPNDRIALAHHGFVLKTQHKRYEEAVDAFLKALEDDVGPATEPRFYYHLGDSLLLLGRFAEAHEVHKRGAALGHFLSPSQRSLYNVDRLKSQPWWDIEKTPYSKLARALEKSWKEILKEGEKAKALYEKEKEGLKERGEWSQLDLFIRGQEIPNRCKTAPVTCSIVRSEVAASGCRRGQVKFSAMEAGTHVRPHVGPTNCRLRMHLGLSNTKDTYIRVDKETRQWEVGKTLMFDDSFEHEVWHNGTGTRLVLIVDVWHPALTPAERSTLPPI